jgi:hypothetical protein
MLGTDVGPAYLPSSFTVPSNADVTISISNFDGATPLADNAVQYLKASGIEGQVSVAPMDPTNPNASATAQTLSAMDSTVVSHTFTVPQLGLNVPIAASSITTFTFHTGAAGVYAWHCMDPCGTGDTGWDGAMAQNGYMAGKLTIA